MCFLIGNSDSEDDLLVIKRQNHELEGQSMGDVDYKLLDEAMNKSAKKPLTKAAIAKKVLKKNIIANKKVVFTDTGDVSYLSCVYYV